MYSAFGVDHGSEEVVKAFNLGGGARARTAGRHAAQSPGMLKQLGSGVKNLFGATGLRMAGAHAGPMKLQNPFGLLRWGAQARRCAPGGTRWGSDRRRTRRATQDREPARGEPRDAQGWGTRRRA